MSKRGLKLLYPSCKNKGTILKKKSGCCCIPSIIALIPQAGPSVARSLLRADSFTLEIHSDQHLPCPPQGAAISSPPDRFLNQVISKDLPQLQTPVGLVEAPVHNLTSLPSLSALISSQVMFPSYPVVTVVIVTVPKWTDLVFGRSNVPWLVELKLSSGKRHVEASDNALPNQQDIIRFLLLWRDDLPCP